MIGPRVEVQVIESGGSDLQKHLPGTDLRVGVPAGLEDRLATSLGEDTGKHDVDCLLLPSSPQAEVSTMSLRAEGAAVRQGSVPHAEARPLETGSEWLRLQRPGAFSH